MRMCLECRFMGADASGTYGKETDGLGGIGWGWVDAAG